MAGSAEPIASRTPPTARQLRVQRGLQQPLDGVREWRQRERQGLGLRPDENVSTRGGLKKLERAAEMTWRDGHASP